MYALSVKVIPDQQLNPGPMYSGHKSNDITMNQEIQLGSFPVRCFSRYFFRLHRRLKALETPYVYI